MGFFVLAKQIHLNSSFDKEDGGARPMEEKLAKERGDAYSWDGFILYIIEMTTITVTKSNAQEVVSMIMQRIERWDFLIDLYDDEIYNPIVRSWSSDAYLNVLDDMIEEDAYHRA